MNNKQLLKIVLVHPEIPPNTGNIIRLCANIGAELHLVKPLGFPLDDVKLRRAGLDYHEYTNLIVHQSWHDCLKYFKNSRLIAIETSGSNYYHNFKFELNDVLVFGSETKGLSNEMLNDFNQEFILKIPMQKSQRSLNLSNSVAIVCYEAWKKLDFIHGINN
jgi:tRNA (cytidine/uridine-2'-O-)-methyltransferase